MSLTHLHLTALALLTFLASCTQGANEADLKVAGGTEDSPGEFASVLSMDTNEGLCTASLLGISGRNLLLLTAAHCGLTEQDGHRQKYESGEPVVLGTETNQDSNLAVNGEIIDVTVPPAYFNILGGNIADFYEPEEYKNAIDDKSRKGIISFELRPHDIALITVSILADSPNFERIKRLRLMKLAEVDAQPGQSIMFVGFGDSSCSKENSQGAGVRRYGYNRVAGTRPDGGIIYSEGNGGSGQLFAETTANFDDASTCSGDSGSPVLMQTEGGQTTIGVVSGGYFTDDRRNVTMIANINFGQNRQLIQDALNQLGSLPQSQNHSAPSGYEVGSDFGGCYHNFDNGQSECFEYENGGSGRDLDAGRSFCQGRGDRWADGQCDANNPNPKLS
jgi:V8-like Glu-specific endopeptidase